MWVGYGWRGWARVLVVKADFRALCWDWLLQASGRGLRSLFHLIDVFYTCGSLLTSIVFILFVVVLIFGF